MNLITNELKQVYKQMIDSLIQEGALSLKCKLIYENSDKTQCTNCEIDPMSGKSSNLYNNSGPVPFINGQICPVCGGEGYLFDSKEEVINLLVLFQYKYWINFNSNINSPDGMIQTICGMELLPKLKNANRLIVDTNLDGITRNIFARTSDPEPAGFGDSSYIFTFWKKI